MILKRTHRLFDTVTRGPLLVRGRAGGPLLVHSEEQVEHLDLDCGVKVNADRKASILVFRALVPTWVGQSARRS